MIPNEQLAEEPLRVGLLSPVQSLRPFGTVDSINFIVLRQIFETAYAPPFSVDRTPEPLLFHGPLVREQTTTGKTRLSAQIRGDIHFSDGTKMTVDLAADALSRAEFLQPYATVSREGDRVLFDLKKPHPRFQLALTPLMAAITLERDGELIGTGAYVPTPDSTPNAMRLVRNEHYRGPVSIPEIQFKVFQRDADGGNSALVSALREGEIDYTSFLSREEIKDIKTVRKSIETGNTTGILFFNTDKPYLAERNVRKALALALDRREIASLFYANPLAYTAAGLLPGSMGDLNDRIYFDLDRAREMLAASGVSFDRPLRMMTIWGSRPYLPRPLEVANLIASQFEKIGVELSIEPAADVNEYYERASSGDYDMVLGGWIPDTPDPADFLDAALHSKFIPDSFVSVASRVNLGRWSSEETDQALRNYRSDPTRDHRNDIAKIVQREVPFLAVLYGPQVVTHSWGLKRYPESFIRDPFFCQMEFRRDD